MTFNTDNEPSCQNVLQQLLNLAEEKLKNTNIASIVSVYTRGTYLDLAAIKQDYINNGSHDYLYVICFSYHIASVHWKLNY